MMVRRLGQRGDTLVEVTIALAIISLVLVSSYSMTIQSLLLARTSRERMQLVQAAQQQTEALTSFRDSTTWSGFITSVPAGNFRMALNGSNQWVPASGVLAPAHAAVAESQIYIRATGSGNRRAFEIHYTQQSASNPSGFDTGVIYLTLVNLDGLRQVP